MQQDTRTLKTAAGYMTVSEAADRLSELAGGAEEASEVLAVWQHGGQWDDACVRSFPFLRRNFPNTSYNAQLDAIDVELAKR